MDESSKEQFRWKFWHLALILNGVVFFYALVIIALFIFPEPARVPGAVISLVIALILTVVFRRSYFKTKAWLDEKNPDKPVN